MDIVTMLIVYVIVGLIVRATVMERREQARRNELFRRHIRGINRTDQIGQPTVSSRSETK